MIYKHITTIYSKNYKGSFTYILSELPKTSLQKCQLCLYNDTPPVGEVSVRLGKEISIIQILGKIKIKRLPNLIYFIT